MCVVTDVSKTPGGDKTNHHPKTNSQPLLLSSVCGGFGGHAFNAQAIYSSAQPSLHVCMELEGQLEVRAQGLLRLFLSICLTLGMYVVFYIPLYLQEFFKVFIP